MTRNLSPDERTRLETRVAERLEALDDNQLLAVADQLDAVSSGDAGEAAGSGLTRRQAVAGILGAGIVGAGLGGAGGWTAGTSEVRQDAQQTIDAWRRLVALYERLDDVGLDSVVARAMERLGGVVSGLRDHVSTVANGVDMAEERLADLDQGLAVLDRGLEAVEGGVSTVADLVARLQDVLAEAGERTGPLGARVAGFFRALLERLPFGLGDDMLAVLDRIEALLAELPDTIESINTELIDPLRTRFFPREGDSVRVRIVEPILEQTLRPVRALLDDVETLLARWEDDFAEPATQRLTKIDNVRAEIQRFRDVHEL